MSLKLWFDGWPVIVRQPVLKGGPGSGHHGHGGRPGQRGGSLSVTSTTVLADTDATSLWKKHYPGDEYQPTEGMDSVVAFDKKGKPVAFCSYFDDEDAPQGTKGAFVDMVRSKAPGAGRDLVRTVQSQYDFISAEQFSGSGKKMLEDTGFKKTPVEGGAGQVYLWLNPRVSGSTKAKLAEFFEEAFEM